MKAADYIRKFAKEMGLIVEDASPLRQMLLVKKGDREVLAFTLREVVTADYSGHPRNWIEPQFKRLECKLREEVQSLSRKANKK